MTTVAQLQELATAARPTNDQDWGSERQLDAENAFFDAFARAGFGSPAFDAFCLKATSEEMIDEALRILATGERERFRAFQATRVAALDLNAVPGIGDVGLEGAPGFVYCGSLYIQRVTEEWPERARAEGAYHLILNRDEWISDDLESLELRLYDFAVGEGMA